MKLTYDKKRKRYVFVGTYTERRVPKEASFRWSPKEKQWWTDDPTRAAMLHTIADNTCRRRLEKIRGRQEASLEQSHADDADVDIPAPPGLRYLPFQKAGIVYALGRRNTLFADQMGLGKSIQALGFINMRGPEKCSRVLIICPASLKINWQRECEKWLVADYSIGTAHAGGTFPTNIPPRVVVIVNYDILKRYEAEIRKTPWCLVIVDECHFLKNPRTQRARQVFGAPPRSKFDTTPILARYKLFLTGTPIVNRPIELWPIVSHLDKRTWGNFWHYAKRYCDARRGKFGWDFTGAAHLRELQEKLRSTIMVRRLKTEVLKDLPPKFRQVIEVPPDALQQDAIDAENEEYRNIQDRLARLRAAVQLAKANEDQDAHAIAVNRLKDAMTAEFTEMARRRREVGERKVSTVAEHVKEVLESVDAVILFCQHHTVIDALYERLAAYCPVKIDGRDTLPHRQEAVDRFQGDKDTRLFIGQIQAAGVGLTLTRSSHVIFAELDWVPGNISQAEDRCHRIGQSDNVLVQHIVLAGSLDARMAKTLVQKQDIIDQALDKDIIAEHFGIEALIDAAGTPQSQPQSQHATVKEKTPC